MKPLAVHSHEESVGAFSDLRLGQQTGLFDAEPFQQVLYLERKRRERSLRPMLLLLIDLMKLRRQARDETVAAIGRILVSVTRETDIKGWYSEGRVIGVIFTELNAFDGNQMVRKIKDGLEGELPLIQVRKLVFSLHVYPQAPGSGRSDMAENPVLYPDVTRRYGLKRGAVIVKRFIDIFGSIVGIVLFSPLFLLIPLLIRATSKGPVLFRQKRMGLYGKKFTFLKFRTMYQNNDPAVHQEYVRKLIAGDAPGGNGGEKTAADAGASPKIFKITNDERITPIGSVLRKTSMDELPQFFNVLRGEMSLVGPRPPIPYEVQNYDLWHRCRVVEVKPGITGLWQVQGRSSTTFNEMVRLDIKYAREWSLWLHLKILVLTLWAVVRGKGAY